MYGSKILHGLLTHKNIRIPTKIYTCPLGKNGMLPKPNFAWAVCRGEKHNTVYFLYKFVFLLSLLYRENYYPSKKIILYIEIIIFPAVYFKIVIHSKTQRKEYKKDIPFCSDKIVTLTRCGFFVSRQLSFQRCNFAYN